MKNMKITIFSIFLMLSVFAPSTLLDARGGRGGGGGHRSGGHRGGGHSHSGRGHGGHGHYHGGGYGRRGYGYGGWGYGAGTAAVLGTTAALGTAAVISSSNNSSNSYQQGYTAGKNETLEQERDRLAQENAALRQQLAAE